MSSAARPEPTHEDYTRWATGRMPRHAPHSPFPRLPHEGNTELVCQPFVQNLRSHGATGVELYKDPKNHADAVGTILNHAAKMANFHPAKGLENMTECFSNYVEKVNSFPGFMLTYNEKTGQDETSGNIDEMIKDIKKAYEGVVGVDTNKVVESINNMANSIINHSAKSADKSVFTQLTIAQEGGHLVTTIFYANLRMEVTKSGKKTYSNQKYHINRAVFKVMTNSLVANAEKLNQLLGDGSYEEWTKCLSSPGGSNASCFETHHASKAQAPREQ